MGESRVVATAPSNIALIKYWGKRDGVAQWPANDSLSMTLSAARTETTAALLDAPHDELWIDGARIATDPRDKAHAHLARLRREVGLGAAPLRIESRNTFPSDCGVASSASGLAALTLAALGAWTDAGSLADLASRGFDTARLAALARLGSGSACRSLMGGYVLWQAGERPEAQSVRQLLAPAAFPLADVIVLLSRDKKLSPSTMAHKAAWTSPLFAPRLAGVPERLARVEAALRASDLSRLGEDIEAEALEMHAVMMTSAPQATYILPRTSEFIVWLRQARRRGDFEAYVTLDAGPNPHVLTRPEDAETVAARIRDAFGAQDLIVDLTGEGPTLTRNAT